VFDGRLGEEGAERGEVEVGGGGDEAVEDEDGDLGAGVAGGDGLAVRPDAEDGICGAGLELGDDGYAHRRCTARVRWESAAGR
jgi:hypothetical protein